MARAVHGNDGKPVGHGVAALHRGPCLALVLLFLGQVAAFVADGRGVDEEFGPLERHEACPLGIPLVPAHLHAQTAHRGVDGVEAQVARGEIELFVVGRVVGDVHLAVSARDGTVALEDHRRVVVEARRAALEEGGHEHHAVLAGQGTVEVGRRSGNGFGEVEVVSAFHLAEVERIVQFLQHHKLRAACGHIGNVLGQLLLVGFYVGRTGLLDETHFEEA